MLDHYNDVIMNAMASQITSLTIVYPSFLFRRRSKKTSKLRVTGLCEGNSPVTGEFPAQRASNAENVSIWWRHHDPIRSQFTGAHLVIFASNRNFIWQSRLIWVWWITWCSRLSNHTVCLVVSVSLLDHKTHRGSPTGPTISWDGIGPIPM